MVVDIGDGEQRVLFKMYHTTASRILDRPFEEVKDEMVQGDFAINADGYLMRYEDSNYSQTRWARLWTPRYRHLHYRDVKPYKLGNVWFWAAKYEDTLDPTLHVQTIKKRLDKDTGTWWILLRLKHLAKPYETWVTQDEAIHIRDALSDMIDWYPKKVEPPDPLIELKHETDMLLGKDKNEHSDV